MTALGFTLYHLGNYIPKGCLDDHAWEGPRASPQATSTRPRFPRIL